MDNDKLKIFKKRILITSILIFTISLFLPAFTANNEGPVGALGCLLFGFTSITKDLGGTAWFANIFIIFGWVYFLKSTLASYFFSLIAFCFSLSFIFLDEVMLGEGGNFYTIIELNAGYYFWIASIVLLSISSCIFLIKEKITIKSVMKSVIKYWNDPGKS
ncbi:MAG: hypothetical protein AAB373_02720 [Patescibacteria group bacterium]